MEASFSSILTVISYRGDSINFMLSVSDSIDSLKKKIFVRWSELHFVDFIMSCLKNGESKNIDSDLDLQSLCSLHIITRSPCFEINIGHVGSSTSTSHSQPSSIVSTGTFLALPNEVDNVSSLHTKEWGCLFKGVGQRFNGGAEDFRIALRKYSFQNGFKTIFLKNHSKRITAKCVGNNTTNCTWFIHAATSPGIKKTLFIKTFINEHCCDLGIRDITKHPLSSKLVKSLIVEEVRDKHDILPKDIQNSVRRNFGMHPNYYFAHKAKDLACEEVYGSHSESFSRLPSYVETLRITNPCSHVVLEVDDLSKKFQRVFIAFEACIHGFQYLRPLVYLDGTHLKGKFKGCLLAATCLDGQDEMYVLAFAIVDSENDSNWKWFLENLRLILQPEDSVITFMSDRHHGLLTYIPIVFPNSHHGFCLWHLKNNLRKALSGSGRSDYIINLFERCCRAPTHELFTEIYSDFINAAGKSVKVLDFIDNAPVHKWANAYFQGKRYGRLCSSLAESFNSWILKERELPITSLIDALRVKIMKMRSRRRDSSLSWSTILCPTVFELLQETRISSRIMKGDKSADGVYEVLSTKKYHVDLGNRYCSCNLWRINGVPCKHAVFCMQVEGLDINAYYDHYFWTDHYRDSYSHAIHPMPTNNVDVSVGDAATVVAPDVKKMPGRPKKNRISSSGSQESTKKPRFCSSCKEHVFHNKRTCKSSLSIPQ